MKLILRNVKALFIELLISYTVNNVLQRSLVIAQYYILYSVSGSRRKASAFRNLIISGYVRQAPCQSSQQLISYQWEVSSKQIKLDPKLSKTPRLFVPRGSLKGGEKYTFTLTAMLADNPSTFSKASVDVDVTSSPLRIKLRGGLKRILGNIKLFCISLLKTC